MKARRSVNEHRHSVDLDVRPFRVSTEFRAPKYTVTPLISPPAPRPKWLGPCERTGFHGLLALRFGLAPTCDGSLYTRQDVGVGRQQDWQHGQLLRRRALSSPTSARSVTVIHRRDEFRRRTYPAGAPALEGPSVKVLWDHVIEEIVGECRQGTAAPSVTGLRMRNVQDPA